MIYVLVLKNLTSYHKGVGKHIVEEQHFAKEGMNTKKKKSYWTTKWKWLTYFCSLLLTRKSKQHKNLTEVSKSTVWNQAGREKLSAVLLGLGVFYCIVRELSRPLLKGAFLCQTPLHKGSHITPSWLLKPEGITSSDWHLHEPMVSTDLPSRDLHVCNFYDFFDIPVSWSLTCCP